MHLGLRFHFGHFLQTVSKIADVTNRRVIHEHASVPSTETTMFSGFLANLYFRGSCTLIDVVTTGMVIRR